jgi:hypothetical protein
MFGLPYGTDWSGALPAVVHQRNDDPGTAQVGSAGEPGRTATGMVARGVENNLDVED